MYELSDDMTKITLEDIAWAWENKYTDQPNWVMMNVLNLMSNKNPKTYRFSYQFKKITGKSLWQPITQPARDWSGCLSDLELCVSKIIGKQYSIQHILINKDDKPYSIRLRRFGNVVNNPVVGTSYIVEKTKDEEGYHYMWDFDENRKMVLISQQLLKEFMIEYNEEI